MNEKNASLDNNTSGSNPLKKWVILLSILTLVFFGTTLYYGFFAKPVFNKEYIKAEIANEQLTGELDTLLLQHEAIKSEYGELSEQLTEKDSVILANAEEIKKLIASQADYKKIKKQLERLQNIAKEYVTEIDQLYTENKMLKEENTQVKASLAESRQQSEDLQKEKEDLNQMISAEAVFKAYNVAFRGIMYKNRGKEEVITERANRVEALKVSFILGENSLIPAGPVNVYCRMAIPESGKVITPGAGDGYSFMHNGERLQYTVKQVINYTGKSEIATMTWDLKQGDKAIKGQYWVQVYTDDTMIGEGSVTLK